jgi:hypothetical protein
VLSARAVTRLLTPRDLPVRLGGYSEGECAVRVESDLEVNCVAISDGSETLVLVSLDLLYVTHALRERVTRGLADLGIQSQALFISASHTHHAPAIDETKPLLGEPETEYRDSIATTIVESIRDALTGPRSTVEVRVATGEASIGENRRRRRLVRLTKRGLRINEVATGPNPDGPTDSAVSVVELRTEGGTLAFIWSAACHPTEIGTGKLVSAHWPGVVNRKLRGLHASESDATNGPAVLFMQGFCGDVRPPSGERPRGLMAALRRIRLGRTFAPLSEKEYSRWSESAADDVCAIALRTSELARPNSLDCARTEKPATDFANGAEGLPPVSFHRVSLGDIVIIGVSAEPVSGYASQLRALVPDKLVIPVGYIDHVVGYWPTAEMYSEGGYEVTGHCSSFAITSCRPDIEEQVIRGCREVLLATP